MIAFIGSDDCGAGHYGARGVTDVTGDLPRIELRPRGAAKKQSGEDARCAVMEPTLSWEVTRPVVLGRILCLLERKHASSRCKFRPCSPLQL